MMTTMQEHAAVEQAILNNVGKASFEDLQSTYDLAARIDLSERDYFAVNHYYREAMMDGLAGDLNSFTLKSSLLSSIVFA